MGAAVAAGVGAALGDWRSELGPGPLEELQDIVLEASRREHEARDWREAVAGRLTVSSLSGTLIRVPDTPANWAAFGSVGTSDDSSPFPHPWGRQLSRGSAELTR